MDSWNHIKFVKSKERIVEWVLNKSYQREIIEALQELTSWSKETRNVLHSTRQLNSLKSNNNVARTKNSVRPEPKVSRLTWYLAFQQMILSLLKLKWWLKNEFKERLNKESELELFYLIKRFKMQHSQSLSNKVTQNKGNLRNNLRVNNVFWERFTISNKVKTTTILENLQLTLFRANLSHCDFQMDPLENLHENPFHWVSFSEFIAPTTKRQTKNQLLWWAHFEKHQWSIIKKRS